ncbi:hypothetical protein MOK15_07225 [Sphingobium sp. BYY-5]|uniref:hypothetical protein n=1 Tax=Sphingobium sp. BYY-5 TaxID=2926400 RepID=UPI001FA6D968|nr:hypothetical protein [Sphingobium sp. BYY-5]MCI4589881.1 hypothetical protein [Sphingobium sp. BYY-5]
MGEDPLAPREPPKGDEQPGRPYGGSIVFILVALALILAIAFFYITNGNRSGRQADQVTEPVDNADNAVSVVADAAKNAADTLLNNN